MTLKAPRRKGHRLLPRARPKRHCRICEAKLQRFEIPEGVCNNCLRRFQTTPSWRYAPPFELAA
jgi:hypothetical protein